MNNTSTNLLVDFGNSLREARKKCGLSQEELALLCEIDRTYISGLERGKRNPTLKMIALVAITLNTTPSQLLNTVGLVE